MSHTKSAAKPAPLLGLRVHGKHRLETTKVGKKVGGVKTLVDLGARKKMVDFYPTNLCWMTVIHISIVKKMVKKH